MPPPHHRQAYRRTHIPLRTGIQLVIEPILLVHWHIRLVFLISDRVDCRDGEYGAGIVEQVPLRCVGPVACAVVGWGGAGGRGADDHVNFFAGGGGGAPVGGVGSAVFVAFGAELVLFCWLVGLLSGGWDRGWGLTF